MSWTNRSLHLRLLATSDLHASLTGYDYYKDRDHARLGLARIATLVHAARAEADQCLLFDNGDLVQGTPLGDWVAKAQAAGHLTENPFISALNTLGYDGATLGNHDFNFGLPYLATALSKAQFPVVVGNIAPRSDADRAMLDIAPWTMLDRAMTDRAGRRHQLKIGVLGLTPPQITTWERDQVGRHMVASPPLETARRLLPDMRAAGADLVIVLCHGGLAPMPDGVENIGLELAKEGGVDAIILGHVHDIFPKPGARLPKGANPATGTLHDIPAVMPGALGSHLGQIDLRLEPRSAGGWRVAQSSSRVLPVARPQGTAPLPEDPKIRALTAPAHHATLRDMAQVLAHQDLPLHSYFAQIGRDLSVRVVTSALRRAGQQFAKTLGLGAIPVLAVGAPFRCGGFGGADNYTDIPAGNITRRDLAALYPFPDRLALLGLTGAELAQWLEHSALAFNTVLPGAQDAPLIRPDMPSYHIDVIDGLTYQIDLSQPAQSRITNLRYQGAPLPADRKFLLATNNYRAGGGGGYPGSGVDRIVMSVPDHIPDLLRKDLETPRAVDPAPFWSFVALPGTTGLLPTGPGAARHLSDIAHFAPQSLGVDAQGFATYRVRLG